MWWINGEGEGESEGGDGDGDVSNIKRCDGAYSEVLTRGLRYQQGGYSSNKRVTVLTMGLG